MYFTLSRSLKWVGGHRDHRRATLKLTAVRGLFYKRVLTNGGLNKMVDILQRTFSNTFCFVKIALSLVKCYWICCYGWFATGLGNGLVLNRWQAITQVNVDHILWRHLATHWPSDAIWRYKSGLTLAQVMACCLAAPSNTWTNVDWSSKVFCGIYLRAVLQSSHKTNP